MLDFLTLTNCRDFHRVTRLLKTYISGARYADRSNEISEFAAPGKRRCTVPDCKRKHYGLGYCSRHWQQHHAGIELPSPPVRTKISKIADQRKGAGKALDE
jgi:hypothetical protein